MYTKDLGTERVWLAAALLALGCGTVRMAVPPKVAETSEVLEASDRSSWTGGLTDEGFKLAKYSVKEVDRDWQSNSGFSVGPFEDKKATTGYEYQLAGGGPTLKGQCGSETKEKSWDLSSSSEVSWGDTTVACSCTGGGDAATLTWSEKSSEMTVQGTTYELEAIFQTDNGGQVSDPVGFTARAGDFLGAVEVTRPGRVWLNKGLDDRTKAKASCLFVGLMLYQPPAEDVGDDDDDD